VTVTGFDTPKFKAAMEGIVTIHGVFTKRIFSGHLLDWNPQIFYGWKSLRAGSRYFTTGPASGDAEIIPFLSTVDPDGILEMMDKQRYRHTIDNDVGYFKREAKGDQKFKYIVA
jgi:hypothetical protein